MPLVYGGGGVFKEEHANTFKAKKLKEMPEAKWDNHLTKTVKKKERGKIYA